MGIREILEDLWEFYVFGIGLDGIFILNVIEKIRGEGGWSRF